MDWRKWFRRKTPTTPTTPAPRVDQRPKRHALAIPDGLTIPTQPDPYRHPLTLPKIPEAVRGSEPGMAMDDAPGGGPGGPFGFLNTAAGLGAFGLYFPGYPFLAELAQRSEFRQPTETTAKEMTRKWIALKSKSKANKGDAIKDLEDDLRKYKIQALFRKVTELDGFYGLGFIYIDVDSGMPSDPLMIDEKTIAKGSLRGFTTIEPMWTTPLVWNSTDPTKPNFYKPDSWMVLGRKTDATRLLRFVSREVPDIIKPAYNFGGISLTQLIQPYVDRWLKTVDSVNKLISNFSIIFLQTDMDALLQGSVNGAGSNALLQRIKLFLQTRDNQGLFLTDKEREMLYQLAVPLSGLSELQAQAQEHMAAPTHLPLVVLTGITPAGLNASSDSEIEVFHDWINSSQEQLYTDHLTKVLHVLMLNRHGKIDDDIVFDYVPLKQLTGEALSRVKKTQSEMDVGYIDAGVVLPEEVRDRVATDPDSGYDNLSSEMPEELTEANEAPTPEELAAAAAAGGDPDDDGEVGKGEGDHVDEEDE